MALKTRFCRLGMTLSIITPMALVPLAFAVAQPAPGEDGPSTRQGPRVESVLVTARKQEEAAQEVPVAMTALSAELKLPTVRGLEDLNGLSASVRIDADPGRAGVPQISIRGVSPTRTDDNSIDSPIGVMIDGIFLGTATGQAIENFDLERIEILRGPQGTLYGRNTVGGVINVVRTRPTGEFGANLQYTFGRWNQQEFRAVLNAPVVRDKLAAKAFFTIQERDGWYKNTFLNTTQPQKDYKNYGISLLATPNDWFEALLTLERFEDHSNASASITNWNLAPGLVAPPTDPHEQDFSGGFLDCFLPVAFGLSNVPCRTELEFPRKEIRTGLPQPGRVNTTAYTLNMSAQLTDEMRLVSVTGIRKTREYRNVDGDGTEVDYIHIERDNHFKQWSEELRLEGNWDTSIGNIKAVAGAYFFSSQFDQTWVTGGDFWQFIGNLSGYSLNTNTWFNPQSAIDTGFATPAAACLAPRTTPALQAVFGQVRCDVTWGDQPYGQLVNKLFEDQKTTSQAGFANADWEFLPGWTLTGGVRWTREKKRFIGAQAYVTPLTRQYVEDFHEFVDLSRTWTNVSPKAGISWKPTDDILVYFSYAQGWHSGGFFGVNQNISDFVRDQYDPETSQSFELGMKSQWLDDRLQVNLAVFRNTFHNKQEQAVQYDDSTKTVATVFSNVASLIYQGFEVEVQAVLTEELRLFGSFGYLDAKYSDFRTDINPNDTCAGLPECIVDASFLNPRNAPEITYGVGATYTIAVGPGDLQFGARYSYVSKVDTNLLNLTSGKLGSREDLNASITYTWDDISVSVFGTNLTNERFEALNIIAPLFAAGTVGPGRAWGIEVTGKF